MMHDVMMMNFWEKNPKLRRINRVEKFVIFTLDTTKKIAIKNMLNGEQFDKTEEERRMSQW